MPFDLGDGNHLRMTYVFTPLISLRFVGFYALDLPPAKVNSHKFVPEIDGPYADFQIVGDTLLTSYGQLYRRQDGEFPKKPILQVPLEKDWTFLAVGDFNGDGQPDAAFLSYGMDKATAARIHYGRKKTELSIAERSDVALPLGEFLNSTKKKENHPLVRDTPVVVDW